MKVVVQRVCAASVTVDDEVTGSIGNGLLLLVGIHEHDTKEQVEWISDKILKLRIFDDEDGRMNLSVQDTNGALLVVSQFTLYGDARKGNRPSYIEAASPQKAEKLYNYMINYLNGNYPDKIETGKFAAHMDVELTNDGPVTLIVEK